MRPYQICVRCVMDTSDPDIQFDSAGVCNHCKHAESVLSSMKEVRENRERYLRTLVDEIKSHGKGRDYDCVIGVSGGVDSSYVAVMVKELGLRPLAVHLDNGWNAELAVYNIHTLLTKLKIDLYTHVIDWEEFRDLQLAFLKASTPDCEIPTDHAIVSLLFNKAKEFGIKHILAGTNFASESIMPKAWSYGHRDWGYVNAINSRYSERKLKTFPHLDVAHVFLSRLGLTPQWIALLNYFDYKKEDAKKRLMEEFGWRDYGGKHFESFYTKFYQAYILPVKFGFDKRRAHCSSLIMAGQMMRHEALAELEKPAFPQNEEEEALDYLCSKFQIDRTEFAHIMENPPRRFEDFDSWEKKLWFRASRFAWEVYKGRRALFPAREA